MVEKNKSVKFLEFLISNFAFCYLASSIIWLMWLGIRSPWYYADARPQDHMNTLVLNILPLSLLPFAISVISNGLFKRRLNPLQVFLSSWYVSTLEVLAFFHFITFTWSPEFTFLSFLIAAILTIVYAMFKETRMKKR